MAPVDFPRFAQCRLTVARDGQSLAKGASDFFGKSCDLCPPLRVCLCSITLHFKKPNGEIVTVEANEGDDIVDVSWEYDLDIEGEFRGPAGRENSLTTPHSIPSILSLVAAACEKSVACSTCHVILEEKVYDSLPEPDDDENVSGARSSLASS